MPQNFFGYYFSMSGSVNCNFARLFLQLFKYFCSAVVVDAWCLPWIRDAALNAALAFRQFSLNQGANCFAHLFGFLWVRWDVAVTTPARCASASRNVSICAARASLLFANMVAVALKASANSYDDVWAVHFAALVPYSYRHSPVIQR